MFLPILRLQKWNEVHHVLLVGRSPIFSCSSGNMVEQSTYNACMTAYEESLARGKFEDGRSIWIDRSGVEVSKLHHETIFDSWYGSDLLIPKYYFIADLFCPDAGHHSPGVWLWRIHNSLQSLRQPVDLYRAQQILGRDGE